MSLRHGLEIRAASGGDAQGVSELLAAAGRPVAPRALADRLEAMRHQPGACLLAVEWGPPSGLIVLHWYGTLDAPLPVAQIDVLLVGTDERRRGVGRLLLKAAAQAARVAGCGALQLAARPDAPALADFCRAAGFIEAGTRFERPLRKKG